MSHNYSVKVVKGKRFLMEADSQIATFKVPHDVKFFSEKAKLRFITFCDSLSVAETIEAISAGF